MDISAAILERIPATLLPSTGVITQLITKWKLFLAPFIVPDMSEAAAMEDSSWSTLGAELIVNLVLFDSLTITYQKYLLTQGGGASSSTSSQGAVKKIVTGPAEAEFFPMSESISEVMKPGGLFTSIKDTICILAHRLDIRLYICDQGTNPKVITPRVYRTRNSSHSHRRRS